MTVETMGHPDGLSHSDTVQWAETLGSWPLIFRGHRNETVSVPSLSQALQALRQTLFPPLGMAVAGLPPPDSTFLRGSWSLVVGGPLSRPI